MYAITLFSVKYSRIQLTIYDLSIYIQFFIQVIKYIISYISQSMSGFYNRIIYLFSLFVRSSVYDWISSKVLKSVYISLSLSFYYGTSYCPRLRPDLRGLSRKIVVYVLSQALDYLCTKLHSYWFSRFGVKAPTDWQIYFRI